MSLTLTFESSPLRSIVVEHLVVLGRDRARLLGGRDLLAEDVDRRHLPLRVQLPDDAAGVLERGARDVALGDPLHDRLRDRRQQPHDGAVEDVPRAG